MVDLVHANAYCIEDISKIENYDKAIADKEITWHCHHRLEIHGENRYTADELIAKNLYFHRPASELIFMTPSEHHSLHNKGKTAWNKGIPMTDEAKKKLSASSKGRKSWNKGKTGIYSEESLRKMSESHKGKTLSDETRLKMLGRTPWNKGKSCKPLTEEHRRKISEAMKGLKYKKRKNNG